MENKVLEVSAKDFQVFKENLSKDIRKEPLYYYKIMEYPLVFNELNLEKGQTCLDIGPGKSIFPLFLYYKGVNVWIIDNGSFYHDFDIFYKKQISHLRSYLTTHNNSFTIIKGDINTANLPENFYDCITAISTLEHLKEENDIKAVKRINRLLKDKGRCVITVPFTTTGTKERYIKAKHSYFQREYELKDIIRRIVAPAGLFLKKLIIFGERNPILGKIFFHKKPLSSFSPLWIKRFPNYFWKIYWKWEKEKKWLEPTSLSKLRYSGCICIVMEKWKKSL